MRKVLEHTFDDGHERLELLRDKDYDLYFAMLDKSIEESEAIALALMCYAARYGCVLIQKEGQPTWYYLHRSPKYYGGLQLTTWDEFGPASDIGVMKPSDFSYLMNGTVTASVEDMPISQQNAI